MVDNSFNEEGNSSVFMNIWRHVITNADIDETRYLMRELQISPDTPFDEGGLRPLTWLLKNPIESLYRQQARLAVTLISNGANLKDSVTPGLLLSEFAYVSHNPMMAACVMSQALLNDLRGGLPETVHKDTLRRAFTLCIGVKEREELLVRVANNHEFIRKNMEEALSEEPVLRDCARDLELDFFLEPFPENIMENDLPRSGANTRRLVRAFAARSAKMMHKKSQEGYEKWEQYHEGRLAVSQWYDLQKLEDNFGCFLGS